MTADTPGGSARFSLAKGSALVAVVSAVIGVAVTANTALINHANAKVARYAGFRQAVAVEESYWQGLFKEYLSAFDDSATNEEKLRRKLFAVSALANHSVPTFDEYAVDPISLSQARTRLKEMQRSLRDALQNAEASTADVAEASRAQTYQQATSEGLRPRSQGEAEAAPVTQGPISAPGFTYQAQVLSRGLYTGWDVDVTWCQGNQELELYGQALGIARTLAAKADAHEVLKPGVRLGRVRLLSIPTTEQASQPAAKGITLTYARQQGAPEAASAVAEKAGGAAATAQMMPGVDDKRWQLTLFICRP